MSSRRGAGEENILAMLERDSARRIGSRMSGVRLAWYGAAAALAGVLAGGIAWLAWDNHKGVQELQARHDAVVAPPAMTDSVPPPQAPPASAPVPVVEAPRTAVIVDESARKQDTAVARSVPPLVMLPPHEVKGAKPPAAAAAVAVAPAPRLVQENLAEKPAKAKPARPAPRSVAGKKPEKAARPAARPAKPARPASVVKTKPEIRPRKAAAGAEAPVDSDVALISAIIAHSERHRGEREAAGACHGAKCPPKSGRP